MGVVSSPPAETSADGASPCFDRTGSVQAVLKRQGRSRQPGDRRQQGGPGMAVIFGPGGLIILPWTVRGDYFRGGIVHGVTKPDYGRSSSN